MVVAERLHHVVNISDATKYYSLHNRIFSIINEIKSRLQMGFSMFFHQFCGKAVRLMQFYNNLKVYSQALSLILVRFLASILWNNHNDDTWNRFNT